MRITYSAAADALSVDLLEGLTARMVKLAPNVNADFDAEGRLTSIEILGASAWYPKEALDQLASPVVWLTLKEAAVEAAKQGEPISPDTLRSQIAKGKLTGEKRGADWVIATHELWNYLERRAPSGRRAAPKGRGRLKVAAEKRAARAIQGALSAKAAKGRSRKLNAAS